MPADMTGGSDFDLMQQAVGGASNMQDQLKAIDVEVDIKPKEGAMKDFVDEYLKGMDDAKQHMDLWSNEIGLKMRETFRPHMAQLGDDLSQVLEGSYSEVMNPI